MAQAPPKTVHPNRRRWAILGGVVVLLAGAAVIWALTRGGGDRVANTHFAKEPEVRDGPAWFADMSAGLGAPFIHKNGEEADHFTILESLGGGVAMIDYDGDGLLDLFFTGGGYFDGEKIKGLPCKLYKNL